MEDDTSEVVPLDILLIGAGIMSATLAVMFKELNPDFKIGLYERLENEAQESSNAWNNAGTGHAALCEMNYTPEKSDGTIDISKALEINTQFDFSRQFWAYLVKRGVINDPQQFLHPVPHHSFVTGKEEITFLKKRFKALTANHCYKGMQYTEDKNQMKEWVPLMMEGRDPNEEIAMTRMTTGTDVDYGALTRIFIASLKNDPNFSIHFLSEVESLQREGSKWKVGIYNRKTKQRYDVLAKFVFIGAGGASLTLLQKSGIPEGHLYAGFPVNGVWLRCDDETIASRHNAKVYAKASRGAPPMSMPHLDRRYVDGKISLLFGPFAGFSTKFLKHGSYLDFFRSINLHNILPMLQVGRDDMELTKYLIGQVIESYDERLNALKQFFPFAKRADWRLEVAGQRVQVIKNDPVKGGILKFGTELVKSADNTIVALLGASPGASTAVFIVRQILEKCFGEMLQQPAMMAKMKEMIPSYGQSLIDNAALCKHLRDETADILKIGKI